MAEFHWLAIRTASSFPLVGVPTEMLEFIISQNPEHSLSRDYPLPCVPGGYNKDFQYFNIQIFSIIKFTLPCLPPECEIYFPLQDLARLT